MKSLLSLKAVAPICAAVLLALPFASWKQSPGSPHQNGRDTIPVKREKQIRNLDDALRELDDADADLEKSVRDIDIKKIEADAKKALEAADADLKKAGEDLKTSLQKIDVEKMRLDAEAALAKVDWNKMQADLAEAKKINLDSLKLQLDEVKVNLQSLKPDLEKTMQQARAGIESAKKELTAYKTFVDGLDRDGLIDKNKAYTIEHRNGQLFINGTQQPSTVYDKYRAFLEKNKTFTLKKTEDDFNLDKD